MSRRVRRTLSSELSDGDLQQLFQCRDLIGIQIQRELQLLEAEIQVELMTVVPPSLRGSVSF